MKFPSKIKQILGVLIILGVGTFFISKIVFAAGTATLSLTPSSGTYAQGDTVSVDVYEDSGGDTVNAVQANLTFPASQLSYIGITNSSAFGVDAQSTAGSG